MRKPAGATLMTLVVMVALLTGCATATQTPVSATKAPATAAPAAAASAGTTARTDAAANPFIGELSVQPKSGPPGTEVTITGKGLPASSEFQLNWMTVDGSWILKGDFNEEFHGRQFKERAVPQGTVKTDANGAFQAKLTAPDGWGFDHNITVVDPKTNKVVNRTNFFVNMQVKMLNSSGPVGTPINFEVKSMGYKSYENSWVLMYDNKVTGWIASVMSEGAAKFSIPATGEPGTHYIQVNHGWASVDYLNFEQTPAAGQRSWTFAFTVTPGDPVLPQPAASQGDKPLPGVVPSGNEPALWTDLASGPIKTPVKLMGRGLTPGATVDIDWWRMVGNRIAGQGWAQTRTTLGKATVAADGTIAMNFNVPDDLGGAHRIEAKTGDTVLAKGSFTITPSILAVEPAKGPSGSTFTVHLKGVGWTETSNIYSLDYDNAYLGFGCGFNSQGDVTINLLATGGPGWHFIDLYPAIYKGEDMAGTVNFRYPMLTGDREHPGEKLAIFHLAFYVAG